MPSPQAVQINAKTCLLIRMIYEININKNTIQTQSWHVPPLWAILVKLGFDGASFLFWKETNCKVFLLFLLILL